MGQTHKSHRFVPAFLLGRWESGPRALLVAFRRENGRFLSSRHEAKAVAKRNHLNSMCRQAPQLDTSLERDYMGPEIDDKAAITLDAMSRASSIAE
jgi:hypothetical protein